jgi:hypothetical protein
VAGLMALYVQHSKWDDALLMVHAHPECRWGGSRGGSGLGRAACLLRHPAACVGSRWPQGVRGGRRPWSFCIQLHVSR